MILVSLIWGIIFMLIVGAACLFIPHLIQRYALNYYEQHPTLAKFNLFLGWMKTWKYVLCLRVMGIAALVCMCFLIYVIYTTTW